MKKKAGVPVLAHTDSIVELVYLCHEAGLLQVDGAYELLYRALDVRFDRLLPHEELVLQVHQVVLGRRQLHDCVCALNGIGNFELRSGPHVLMVMDLVTLSG